MPSGRKRLPPPPPPPPPPTHPMPPALQQEDASSDDISTHFCKGLTMTYESGVRVRVTGGTSMRYESTPSRTGRTRLGIRPRGRPLPSALLPSASRITHMMQREQTMRGDRSDGNAHRYSIYKCPCWKKPKLSDGLWIARRVCCLLVGEERRRLDQPVLCTAAGHRHFSCVPRWILYG